jgi:hypothetical protein
MRSEQKGAKDVSSSADHMPSSPQGKCTPDDGHFTVGHQLQARAASTSVQRPTYLHITLWHGGQGKAWCLVVHAEVFLPVCASLYLFRLGVAAQVEFESKV